MNLKLLQQVLMAAAVTAHANAYAPADDVDRQVWLVLGNGTRSKRVLRGAE